MVESRRSVLRRGGGLLGVVGAGGLAGCSDTSGASGGAFDAGYAAFFTLNDWANRVAGERASFTDPVDVGRLGHGWEPDGNLTADVAGGDAFVYLDTAELAWAQDIAATLRADYPEIAVIDGLDGLEDQLLAWDHGSHEADGDAEDGHDGGSGEGDHDGDVDPHVWVDPEIAKTIVDTIAAGLSEADPDGADAYAANAEAYREDLDEVDAAFESLVADAERDRVVLAGHDSFGYLAERYGFDVHSPVGVSPQNEPTSSEIADTIDVVDDDGIDVVLYDRFQSPRLAETVVENSTASETMAVTSAGGTTREWNEAGYGYREQMLEINAPAFGAALGAE